MNRTILVVDADPIQRRVVKQELDDAGFEVLLAESGASGIELFAERSPMLTIVEINLPDESGAHVCRRMKTDPELPGGLVVLVSAGVKEVTSVADAALQFHADYYMTKPFQVERLIWKTAELIRGRRVGLAPGHEWPIGLELPTLSVGGEAGVTTGELADVDPATLLFSFFVHRRSGSLVLTRGDVVRQVVFRSGLPIAADSNADGEEFGSFAVGIGTCDAGEMARARAAWESIDRHLGVVAVSQGGMGARDLFRTMRLHLEHVIMASLTMATGQYFKEFGAVPPNFDPVGLRWLPAEYVMRGIAQGYDDDTCLVRLGEGWLATANHAHFVVREIDGGRRHERLLERMRRPARVRDLFEEGRVDTEDGSLQALLGLRTIGALWVVDPTQEPAPRPARTSPPPPPADVDDPETLSLDVGPAEEPETLSLDASPPGSPETLSLDVGPPDEPETPSLDAGLTDDPETLSLDTGLTDELEAVGPETPAALREVAVVSVSPERTAEEHFEQGSVRFGEGRYSSARDAFERALALAPERAGYHLSLAQSMLLDPEAVERLRDEAIGHLRRAIQLEPRRADSYHFLGAALADLGRRDEAEFALRKALKLRTRYAKDARRLLEELAELEETLG